LSLRRDKSDLQGRRLSFASRESRDKERASRRRPGDASLLDEIIILGDGQLEIDFLYLER